jgi:hypothetical protein
LIFLMSTPAKRLRAARRIPLMAFLLALASSAVWGRAPAVAPLQSVRLGVAGHPGFAAAVVWGKQDQHDGLIDIGLESELYAITADDPTAPLVLYVRAASAAPRVSVRQRSVTYLNLSEEGPHIAVPGTERRSAWTTLRATSNGGFRVLDTVRQAVRMSPKQLAAVLGNQPTWLRLAQACRGADDGACYTVTDPEFEITVTADDGRVTRAIVRVATPNGC